MAYDIDLQSNNTELQEILDTINALPEAGSGGESSSGFEPLTYSLEIDTSDLTFGILEGVHYSKYSEPYFSFIDDFENNKVYDDVVVDTAVIVSGMDIYSMPMNYSSGSGLIFQTITSPLGEIGFRMMNDGSYTGGAHVKIQIKDVI